VAADAIPKWKGTRITRTVREWTLVRPRSRRVATASDGVAAVYRFKIVLVDSDPAIWRRIETKDVTLEQLHGLIQTAMGWTNSHLHQFEIAKARYADPRSMMDGFDDLGTLDYSGIRISDLVSRHGPKLRMGYEYDFGDGWQHKVVLEKTTPSEPGVKYPRCIDGERAFPPEEIGGICGFADYVEAIANPNHSEHENWLKWHGPFDPAQFDAAQFDAAQFDAEKATRRMRKGLPTW
jgi:hypothetical protein